MDNFTIQIARTNLGILAEFGSTREYFKDYIVNDAPEATLWVSAAQRQAEQLLLDEEAIREKLRRREFSQPFLERSGFLRKTAAALLEKDILLLHGSSLIVEGKAYLFTADCGVGKSTHARLWRTLLGERAQILNDDRAFIDLTQPVTAYSCPWSGKHGLQNNLSAPLGGICILSRGTVNEMTPMPPDEGINALEKQIFLPHGQTDLSAFALRLFREVPVWHLQCTRDLQAAELSWRTMTGVSQKDNFTDCCRNPNEG